jgi:hypothetical protein
MNSPAWPALAAAVHAAVEWTPDQLIATVADGLRDGDGFTVPTAQLCDAMVWRIATLTDVPHEPDDAPLDPLDLEAAPPEDVHLLDTASSQPGTESSRARILELNQTGLRLLRQAVSALLGTRLSPRPPRQRSGGRPAILGGLRATRADKPDPTPDQARCHRGGARRCWPRPPHNRGHLVDAFKDRLIIPLREPDGIVGFIGRRNPTKDDTEYAGPKYLNTRSTAAFSKSEVLFGLVETSEDLRDGAVPVLVEGPLDALAVTLAGCGQYVGVAPLGTAFTEAQAAKLKPILKVEPSRVVIATDPDDAGWASAQRAFWQLAAMGANPRYVDLPHGVDPADLLVLRGREALADSLTECRLFASALVEKLVADLDEPGSPAARLRLVREAGQIIGALPPQEWAKHIDEVTTRHSLPAGMLHMEVIDAGALWTEQPREQVSRLASAMAPTPRTDRRSEQSAASWPAASWVAPTTPKLAPGAAAVTLDGRGAPRTGPRR